MADVSVKMGVSGVSQFIQSMQQTGAAVKSIDAALKLNEKQLKATGDAETYMSQKSQLLMGKLKEQERITKEAEKALKALDENGTSKTGKAYQDMQRKLLDAQSAMLDTQNQINELGTASAEASGKTDQLANSLGGLNQKVSLEQVRSAIGSITTGMENAAKKAAELGKAIWEEVMDTARRADDLETMALIYDIPVQRLKQMQALVAGGMDTTVESMLSAQDKLNRGIGNNSSAVLDVLRELNLMQTIGTKYGKVEFIPEDSVKLFWEAGQALMAMGDAYDKEAAASALFGKSWKELKPLFDAYKSVEEYNEALEGVSVSSEEATKNAAELADRVGALESTWTQLKDEIFGAISPALSGAATALEGLLGRVLEFLETPEGKQALEDMGKAVEGLFSDLSNIDPQEVVAGFSQVFEDIVGGLQWLSNNSETVIGALKAIVIGWGALELVGGALDILKLIQGITGLTATSTITQAGAAAGAAWGSSFASAVLAAAPWLAGLITLLTPATTGDNTLVRNGSLTGEGWSDFLLQRQRFMESGATGVWSDLIAEVGEFVDSASNLWNDEQGIGALVRYLESNDREQLIRELEALGYTRKPTDEELRGVNVQAEVVHVDSGGGMYDAEGNRVGYQMPAGDVAIFKNRRTGQVEGEAPIAIDPVVPEGAEEQIAEEIGPVAIPVELIIRDLDDAELADLLGGGEHANGLWSVPFDGYHAILHKGERVVPAREVNSSRNFSSNLYVESMYMNNGQDAEGLAAAMAAAQRRTMSGYGS